MEMEIEELGDEVAPHDQEEIMEEIEDMGADVERPTSTMNEAIPQEPTSPMEVVEQIDDMGVTGADPQ